MNPLLLALTLLAVPQDSGSMVPTDSPADSSQALPAVSLAPRIENISLLGTVASANALPMFPVDTNPEPGGPGRCDTVICITPG